MRKWTRATRACWCGRCENRLINPGEPILEITVVGRVLVRCVTCEGPAPPDLPALIVTRPITPRRDPVALRSLLPLDFSRRAAGEREPGEEG